MAGISMHLPVGDQPNAALSYEVSDGLGFSRDFPAGLSWSRDCHELHARFSPINIVTELLFGTLSLVLLMGLLIVSLVTAAAGWLSRLDLTAALSGLALGIPMAIIWALMAVQSAAHLWRRLRYHSHFTDLHADPSGLTIACPTEWGQRTHHIPANEIHRLDAYTTGFDLSAARIVYLRIWSGDDYQVTEIRFAGRQSDLPDRLLEALHDALQLLPPDQRRPTPPAPALIG